MFLNHIILAILWAAFCVLHSLLADEKIRNFIGKLLGRNEKYYRILYSLFAFISLSAVVLYQLSIPARSLFQYPGAVWQLPAVLISGAGLLIMLICTRRYFFRVTGLVRLMEKKEPDGLLISGIHRHVRHPLYLGTLLFIWGLFLLIPVMSLLIMNVIVTLYTLFGIRLEEKKLVKEFGAEYENYRKNVPMLLPSFRRKQAGPVPSSKKGVSPI